MAKKRIIFGGYLRDKKDKRDKIFAWSERPLKSARIKRAVDLSLPGQKIRRQSGNSCTGYAGACALRIAIAHHEKLDPGELSGDFLYYTGRAVWDGESKDKGSYIRTLFKAMEIQGACRDGFHPQSLGRFKKPSWKAVKNGFKHRGLKSYRRIMTPDEAREALSEGIPLVGGWDVGTDFSSWKGGEAFNRETQVRGGHAMAVVGYTRGGEYILANSWGSGAGENGRWRVSEKFLMSGGRLWACDTKETK